MKPEIVSLILSSATLIVGIGVLCIYYHQLNEMRKATELTTKSLAFTREVVERPYLVMEALNPVDDRTSGTPGHPMGFETGKRPSFNVGIRNAGRSPTGNVSVNVEIRETFAPIQFPLQFDGGKTVKRFLPIPGSSTRYRWATRATAFTQQEVDELRLVPPRRRYFYVLGFIDYWDVSGKTKYDRVEFCMVFNPDQLRPYTPDGNVLFDVCQEANASERED